MNSSIAKNYMYNLLYQILAIFIPLITTPYISRVLGANNIGIYSYTLSISTYFILIGSLGLALYGQREIAYVQTDIKNRTRIFFEIQILKTFFMLISILLFYLAFCVNGLYSIYFKILILELVANIFDISWFFQGLEEFKKTVIRNIIVKLFSVICIFIFVKSTNDLMIYFIIYVLSVLFGNLTLWLYLPKFISFSLGVRLRFIEHIPPALSLFIPQVATQIYTVLDRSMLGTIISDKAEVGYYEQSQKMIKLLLTIATSLGVVMLPRIAATFAEGNRKKVKMYMYNSFNFVAFITFPLMFGLISISREFVPLFFGPGFDKVAVLLIISSPIIIFIGFSNVSGTQYLLPTKQQKKYTISVFIGAFLNFVVNLILIKKFQSVGVSIATLIAEFSVTSTQFFFIKKDLNIKKIIYSSRNYFFASLTMYILTSLFSIFIEKGIVSIIFKIVLSSIIYFSMLILLRDKIINNLLSKIKK